MEIVHYPHPVLRFKSLPITRIDADLKAKIAEMFELMYAAKGIGLAANQVGLPFRFFVINPSGDPKQKEFEQVFINPEIISKKGSEEGEEGCLSLPDVYGPVKRAAKIKVVAYDLTGQEFEWEVDDLTARVIQHENDHLDGVLFIDRIPEQSLAEAEQFLTEFETVFRRRQADGELKSDEELEAELKGMAQTA
ncbi:peptide deformylase [Thalassoroseus pseudoceratinae]|uniref:peptide deformylase n=1 Tax=Thalassoroseus pseudoceratinae TaxID=2713176 RepID=UPI00197DA2B1|nr:peptide deformylase [Thalassoroseus pseudoceratinae]